MLTLCGSRLQVPEKQLDENKVKQVSSSTQWAYDRSYDDIMLLPLLPSLQVCALSLLSRFSPQLCVAGAGYGRPDSSPKSRQGSAAEQVRPELASASACHMASSACSMAAEIKQYYTATVLDDHQAAGMCATLSVSVPTVLCVVHPLHPQ